MKAATATTAHGNKCFVVLDYLNFNMYDGKNIMKYKIGELKMNVKLLLSACLVCLFGTAGCVRQNAQNAQLCTGADCAGTEVVRETVVTQDGYICQTADDPALCPKDQFVNYTRTAADFREYGERTPRDRLVSQAAAGNNLSASIPPSIEDEVIEYEEQIEISVPADTEVVTSVTQTTVENTDNSADDTQEIIEVEEVEETDDVENSEDIEDPVQDWLAEEGQNLKALLTEWSEQSGWRLVWNTNRNYVLSAGAMFRGRFADVSSALIRAFARARPAPIATFYKGNRVLVVETMEDENAYE